MYRVFMIQFFMLSLKYGNKLDWVSRAPADQGGTSYSQANILKLIRKHWPQNKIITVTQLALYDCILGFDALIPNILNLTLVIFSQKYHGQTLQFNI